MSDRSFHYGKRLPVVGVALLTWNAQDVVEHALQHLLRQRGILLKVVVIDNGSEDNTRRIVNAYRPKLADVLTLPENLGYAAGMNRGVKRLLDTDFICLLNCDVFLDPDYLSGGVHALTNRRDLALVAGPLVRLPEGVLDAGALRLTLDARLKRIPGTNHECCFKVNGAAPVIRTAVIRHLINADGYLFDERFDTYYEDVDLSLRLLRSRALARLDAGMTGAHLRSYASARTFIAKPPRLRRNKIRGRYRILFRYYPLPVLVPALFILFLQDLALIAYAIVLRRPPLLLDVVSSWQTLCRDLFNELRVRRARGPLSWYEWRFARRGLPRTER